MTISTTPGADPIAGQELSRKFALHDRFSLMRRNAGHPTLVCGIISYPSTTALPSISHLEKRVLELQEHFPMLWTTVDGRRTTSPVHVPKEQKWSSEDIISQGTYDHQGAKDLELGKVLKAEVGKLLSTINDESPMWSIRILTHPSSSSSTLQNKDEKAYIVVTIDHIIGDGKALTLLIQAILSDDISHLPYETLSTIPGLEETANLNPSIGYMIPVLFKQFILPYLPTFIGSYFKENQAWPKGFYREIPKNLESDMSLLRIPPTLVASVKANGKANGVNTLHPILKAAYLSATWAKFRHAHQENQPFVLKASSPRSERDTMSGHSALTANYVTQLTKDYILTPTDDFWQLAQLISKQLADPVERQKSKYEFGSLTLIPDGLYTPPEGSSESEAEELAKYRPTKWEDFFLTKTEKSPYGDSFGMSNLGLAHLPKGANDLAWTQAASPFGPGFALQVIGHEGGLRICTTWREGGAVIREEINALESVVVKLLEKIAVNGAETTLDKLVLDL